MKEPLAEVQMDLTEESVREMRQSVVDAMDFNDEGACAFCGSVLEDHTVSCGGTKLLAFFDVMLAGLEKQ